MSTLLLLCSGWGADGYLGYSPVSFKTSIWLLEVTGNNIARFGDHGGSHPWWMREPFQMCENCVHELLLMNRSSHWPIMFQLCSQEVAYMACWSALQNLVLCSISGNVTDPRMLWRTVREPLVRGLGKWNLNTTRRPQGFFLHNSWSIDLCSAHYVMA